mgnify:CR=1 FL=1
MRTRRVRWFVCETHSKKVFLGGFADFFAIFGQLCECSTTNSFFSELEICMQLSWHTKGGKYEVSELYLETGRFYRHVSNPENGKTAKGVRDQILPLL